MTRRSGAGASGGAMARRSAVQHGPETAAHDGGVPHDPWDMPGGMGAPGGGSGTGAKGRSARHGGGGGGRWAGSGGRWWVWAGRVIRWALIIVIVVNGIPAPFERFTADQPAGSGTAQPDAKSRFPVGAASAYALEFTGAYLNYDQRTAADRQRRLEYFAPEGADVQFGWNGVGQLRVQSM